MAVRFSSPLFCLICGAKAMCGKGAPLLTAFWVTFVATYGEAILSTYKKRTTTKNVTGPPAAKSGYTPCRAAL